MTVTLGEALANIMFGVAGIWHSVLSNWVEVTDPEGNGGGQLEFAVAPAGAAFAQWASDMLGAYAVVLHQLTDIPLLGASIAKFLVILM